MNDLLTSRSIFERFLWSEGHEMTPLSPEQQISKQTPISLLLNNSIEVCLSIFQN